jgi:hypothetical protein
MFTTSDSSTAAANNLGVLVHQIELNYRAISSRTGYELSIVLPNQELAAPVVSLGKGKGGNAGRGGGYGRRIRCHWDGPAVGEGGSGARAGLSRREERRRGAGRTGRSRR